MTMTLKAAVETAGKVSLGNGKMPGSTFAISATKCNVGGKLANLKGSTCSRCYALKLEKLRPSVHKGWLANYEKATRMVETMPEQWAKAAAFQINKAYEKSNEPFHRWFDSGDLQSLAMLSAIAMVCNMTPNINHWLPTREAKLVKEWLKHNQCPPNLVIRVSSAMIGDNPMQYPNTSTVHRKGEGYNGNECPASKQGNNCGACRNCWDKNVANISYPLH